MLTECINSLLAGEDRPDEIWVYDDFSSEPAERHIPPNAEAKVIRGGENKGPSHGRNTLLHSATSDYIHFHDADDQFDSHWCEMIRKSLLDTQPDLIVSECLRYSGNRYVGPVFDLRTLETSDDIIAFFLLGSTNTQSLTFRRDLALQTGGYQTEDLKAALDYFFNSCLALVATSFTICREAIVIEELRPLSLTRTSAGTLSIAHRQQCLRAIELLSARTPPQYLNHLAELAVSIASQLYTAGSFQDATYGFSLARQIGRPRYSLMSRPYRLVAGIFGPIIAERLSAAYRMAVPASIRTVVYGPINGKRG